VLAPFVFIRLPVSFACDSVPVHQSFLLYVQVVNGAIDNASQYSNDSSRAEYHTLFMKRGQFEHQPLARYRKFRPVHNIEQQYGRRTISSESDHRFFTSKGTRDDHNVSFHTAQNQAFVVLTASAIKARSSRKWETLL
jgi:hypothetical protein